MTSDDSKKKQLRSIRKELWKTMHHELASWESARVQEICDRAYERERSMDGVRDFHGSLWDELVEKPVEEDWKNYRIQWRQKTKELGEKAKDCLRFWQGEFDRLGAPPFRM